MLGPKGAKLNHRSVSYRFALKRNHGTDGTVKVRLKALTRNRNLKCGRQAVDRTLEIDAESLSIG